ncbi:hypothetical protein PybrP1_006090 [[Pythium] brassicae (nom. inval.)]|nr:hypothetical protein PybrP1_006090 [[Pythium] brassicae (nom. inval.)]
MSESTTADVRPSSVVMLRQSDDPNSRDSSGTDSERQSWWNVSAPKAAREPRSGAELALLGVQALLVAALPVALLVAALHSANRALPFFFSAGAALAGAEFTWLAYRVALRLYLPFLLHQKQTCRDMYKQIMTYSVDLDTCAVTPLAERALGGRKRATALLLALVAAGAGLAVPLLLALEPVVAAYSAMSAFLGVYCAALAPSLPDGAVLLARFGYYFVASLNVVMTVDGSPPAAGDTEARAGGRDAADARGSVLNEPLTLEPFALALGTAGLMLLCRVLTSKDAMQSTVFVLLDITGLVYLGAVATVLGYFARAAAAYHATADGTAAGGLLLALFVVAWSSELGSYLTERVLKFVDYPWNHPLAARVSSRQNVETLVGALAGGVAATFVVAEYVNLHMATGLAACAAAGAVLASQVCKLLLLSLKKVAQVAVTGEYLSVGGGVLDRVDTVLFMAIVLCPIFEHQLRLDAML